MQTGDIIIANKQDWSSILNRYKHQSDWSSAWLVYWVDDNDVIQYNNKINKYTLKLYPLLNNTDTDWTEIIYKYQLISLVKLKQKSKKQQILLSKIRTFLNNKHENKIKTLLSSVLDIPDTSFDTSELPKLWTHFNYYYQRPVCLYSKYRMSIDTKILFVCMILVVLVLIILAVLFPTPKCTL